MDRRDFERRHQSRSYTKDMFRPTQANITGKIHSWEDITPDHKTFLASRVSGRKQRSHLKHQISILTDKVASRGSVVAGEFSHIGPGWDLTWLKVLVEEALKFQRFGFKVCILAETIDRLIRNKNYHPIFNPDQPATDDDISKLLQVAKGIPLMVLNIEVDPGKQRSQQTKRGKTMVRKEKYMGYKADQKKRFIEKAVELRKSGLSFRKIAEHITNLSGYEISHIGIMKWLKESQNLPG